ncbi:MAG TPA: PilZ domain-containing protein [Patescibacteria group bacterium]|nr:PilZ domain-containing protein [Patescibacteria group bacterium]
MSTEQRKVFRRLRKRVEVRYGIKEPEHTGYSGNISRSGMMIRAIRVFGHGTILVLDLKFPEKTYRVRGSVSWAREGTVQYLSTGRVGMGIKFIDPPADLLAMLESGGSL